ncbi:MAG: hypothetical protein ABL876_02375 [Chitinophagaceae bacterium]
MNTVINDTRSDKGIQKDPVSLAKNALKIIWFTGIICVAIIFISLFTSSAVVPGNKFLINKTENNDVRSIDELLLTSEEALLSDKKSFVNGALRFQWRNQEPDLNQENNRAILYNNILKKKLQKIRKEEEADFSVGPVPK